MTEIFRVVKTASGQPIRAYKKVNDEIGSDMDRDDYILELAEQFGNPTFVLTKKQFLQRLMLAADAVQMKMQKSTVAVAGLKVEII